MSASYASIKARMRTDTAGAENCRATAEASEPACEERVEEATAAVAWADRTGEDMQVLKVDGDTLEAMEAHQQAHGTAQQAEAAVADALAQVKKAWARCGDTAAGVTSAMDASGHGGVQDARDNAAGGGAARDFYQPQ